MRHLLGTPRWMRWYDTLAYKESTQNSGVQTIRFLRLLMSPFDLTRERTLQSGSPLLDHIVFIVTDASCLLTSIPGTPRPKHDSPHLPLQCGVFMYSSSEIAPNFAIYCSAGIVLTDHRTPEQELSFAFLENSDQQGIVFILGFYRLLDWGRQCLVRQTWVIGTRVDTDMNFSWSSWGFMVL